jgi:hypothetical protein
MRHANRRVKFWILATSISFTMAFNSLIHAQAGPAGAPVIKTSSGTIADPIFIDAFAATTGTDICARISSAWSNAVTATLPSAVIDARGFTYANAPHGAGTAWQCSGSPFPTTVSGGKLLLGNVLIQTSVPWVIPSRVHVEGIGVAGLTAGTTNNTRITAIRGSSGTPPSEVIELGTGSGTQYDVQVRGLTVDAAGLAATGILNNSAEEGSTVEDVNIFNASVTGLLIQAASTSGADNSGPYRNINIQYNSCSSCSASTTGIEVSVASGSSPKNSGIRGIDNVTISGGGVGQIGNCIVVTNYPVQITNSHLEYCTTGIQIGASGNTTGNVEVQNVSICCSGWGIILTNSGDITLNGIAVDGTQVLDDTVTGNLITGPSGPNYLGFYLLGDPAVPGTNTTVISTHAGISTGWVAPGNLHVVGTLSKGMGMFKIDDPLDPANKYLYHSFVESPDMMNVYNGSVTTDKHGIATVTLPDYFQALNGDFRYQLTAIGTLAQATVAKKIENNHFTIRTNKPGVEVSWQVTGIRQDAYANAHRVQVEEQKPPIEQGHYLHPELTGASGKEAITREASSK